jgi:hypothetical protein
VINWLVNRNYVNVGFGGTGGIYGAYVHDPSQPWYKGWSAYTVVTYGGGGAGTVRDAGGGLYIGGSNASNNLFFCIDLRKQNF